jgi:hypothetical protein
MKQECGCDRFYLAIETIRKYASPPPTLMRMRRSVRTKLRGDDPAKGLVRYTQDHYVCSICATEWVEDQELGWFRADESVPGSTVVRG